MQFGCFSTPEDVPYESDYRSEYQKLRDIPDVVFATGGHCYKGIASVSTKNIKQLKCKSGDVLCYAKNIFWKRGYSMEPVAEGGFRRYPVDYTIRLSLTKAKCDWTGTPQNIRIVLQDVVDTKKRSRRFRLCANDGGVWGWSSDDTEELPWTPEADIFGAIAKCAWKSNWIVGAYINWSERKGRFEEFKESLTETIKKAHPDGAFDVRIDEETLISTWLFRKNEGLTDILTL